MTTQASDVLHVRNAPSLPDFIFRRFRGPEDYAAMSNVINASSAADGIERASAAEEVANTYAHLSNCDPRTDVIIAEAGGEMVGYSRAWWWQEPHGTRLYGHIGFLDPRWRRKGIGTAMLQWMQARLQRIAATHPQDGERLFQAFASDAEAGTNALLLGDGYTAVRYGNDMLRPTLDDLPHVLLPAGLEVRPVAPEHYRLIWDAADEAFQDHWGYSPSTAEDYHQWLNDPVLFTPQLWRVAWDTQTNQVAGQVRSFINHAENAKYNRKRGYTEFISVRRPWRKRGLARALIVESFHALKAQGMTEAALGVDAENLSGALRVYEGVGFRVTKRSTTYRKPLPSLNGLQQGEQ
jgi:ribosomal protein S18 acetylase RimI-like enzyme